MKTFSCFLSTMTPFKAVSIFYYVLLARKGTNIKVENKVKNRGFGLEWLITNLLRSFNLKSKPKLYYKQEYITTHLRIHVFMYMSLIYVHGAHAYHLHTMY